MRWIFLLPGCFCCLYLPARAGHSPTPVLMRVYVQTTGAGQENTQAREIRVPPNGETIMIRALPEVTEAELTDVHTDASQNVIFQFDHQGQVALDVVTAENQGRILVVMINGYVVYAPTIDEELSNGQLTLPRQLNPEVIQQLQLTAKRNVEETKKD